VEYLAVAVVVAVQKHQSQNQNQWFKKQLNLKKRLALVCAVQNAEAVNSYRMHV
jgi:hypothetical protein